MNNVLPFTHRPQMLRTHRPFIIHEGPKPDYVKWLAERDHRLPDYSPLDGFGDDDAEALSWSMLFFAGLCGFVAGMLVTAGLAYVWSWFL